MCEIPPALGETFSGAGSLTQQTHQSQDRHTIEEVGTDPAGTSDHGHDAAERSV